MQVVENAKDIGSTIAMDDKNFINCEFKNCTLTYAGGDWGWTNTKFENCPVQLFGAAQRTAALLNVLNGTNGAAIPALPVVSKKGGDDTIQ